MKQFLVWLSAALMAGCSSPIAHDIKQAACANEVNLAVLNVLSTEFHAMPSSGFAAYLDHPTEEQLDSWQKRIDAVRKWNQSNADRCVREAYEGWLDFYQSGLNDARYELINHTEAKEMQRYDEERKAEDSSVREYERSMPVPKPPNEGFLK